MKAPECETLCHWESLSNALSGAAKSGWESQGSFATERDSLPLTSVCRGQGRAGTRKGRDRDSRRESRSFAQTLRTALFWCRHCFLHVPLASVSDPWLRIRGGWESGAGTWSLQLRTQPSGSSPVSVGGDPEPPRRHRRKATFPASWEGSWLLTGGLNPPPSGQSRDAGCRRARSAHL